MTARPRQSDRPRTIRLFAIVWFLLWAVCCTSKEPPIWVTVVFDVEDYTTPVSEGLAGVPSDRPRWE